MTTSLEHSTPFHRCESRCCRSRWQRRTALGQQNDSPPARASERRSCRPVREDHRGDHFLRDDRRPVDQRLLGRPVGAIFLLLGSMFMTTAFGIFVTTCRTVASH